MAKEEIKYLNQCFQCMQVIKPRPADDKFSYAMRRYCGKECVDLYMEEKRRQSGGRKYYEIKK